MNIIIPVLLFFFIISRKIAKYETSYKIMQGSLLKKNLNVCTLPDKYKLY